jgi:hypothetical protein
MIWNLGHREVAGFKGSRAFKREPQNIEQGIMNVEGEK